MFFLSVAFNMIAGYITAHNTLKDILHRLVVQHADADFQCCFCADIVDNANVYIVEMKPLIYFLETSHIHEKKQLLRTSQLF